MGQKVISLESNWIGIIVRLRYLKSGNEGSIHKIEKCSATYNYQSAISEQKLKYLVVKKQRELAR